MAVPIGIIDFEPNSRLIPLTHDSCGFLDWRDSSGVGCPLLFRRLGGLAQRFEWVFFERTDDYTTTHPLEMGGSDLEILTVARSGGAVPSLYLTADLCNMHNACMSTKTISLRLEAYNKLKAARRFPGESFSQVILRARWQEDTVTAAELMERCRLGAHFSEEDLERVERLKRDDRPPEDKWADR